jgi:hypothetical protein
MSGGEGTEGEAGYLPPEPPGKEPDLGDAAPQTPTSPAAGAYQAPQPYGQPGNLGGQGQAWQQGQGWQQGHPAQYAYPPAQGPPPPPGWAPPPPAWQQPPPPQPWAYQPPQPVVPDNGQAVAGFVLSLVSLGLLLMSAGLSTIVSLVCGGLGIMYSVRGRRRVDRGETPKHRGLAQAGFVVGIVAVVLSVLATAGWIAAIASEDFLDELDNNGGGRGFETTVRLSAAALCAGVRLLA